MNRLRNREKEIEETTARDLLRHQCESVVEEGLDAIMKVARALEIIESFHLYDNALGWTDYCRQRWNMDEEEVRLLKAHLQNPPKKEQNDEHE